MQPTVYIPSRPMHLMAPPAVRTVGTVDVGEQIREAGRPTWLTLPASVVPETAVVPAPGEA